MPTTPPLEPIIETVTAEEFVYPEEIRQATVSYTVERGNKKESPNVPPSEETEFMPITNQSLNE